MGADGQFGKLSSGLGGQSLSRRDWSGHLPDPWRLPLDQAQQGGGSWGIVVPAASNPQMHRGTQAGERPLCLQVSPGGACEWRLVLRNWLP